MYASMYVNRAAYFLGGVLTGILGIAAAACISCHMDEKRRQRESISSPRADLPEEEACATEAAESPDADAAQTA